MNPKTKHTTNRTAEDAMKPGRPKWLSRNKPRNKSVSHPTEADHGMNGNGQAMHAHNLLVNETADRKKTLNLSQNKFRILIFTGAYTRHRSRKVLVMEVHFELRRRGASGNDEEIVASEEALYAERHA